jgi:hypothetical protein
MASLTMRLPPFPPSARGPIQIDSWEESETQGAESKRLHEVAGQALSHWNERIASVLESASTLEDWTSVPLEPAFTAKVIYRHVGDLSPFPYSADE